MAEEEQSQVADAKIWQQSLIDAALDAVLIIDEDGYLIDFNRSAETTFGYKREAVIGKLMSDLIIPPSLRQAHTHGLNRIRQTNMPKILGQRLELPAVRSDGSEFPVELIVVQVPIKPRPLYVGYVRDISDRKNTEEALRASAKQFQALADSAPLMIWLADQDGAAQWFNKSWLEFTGRPLQDVVGTGWIDVLHPDDVTSYLESYQTTLQTGESFSREYRLLHVDGTYHWVLGKVAATLHPDGSIAGYAGSCVDITSRRKTEVALRLTQFAVDGAADAIFWVRPDASLHYVNDQACRGLGYRREELLEMKATDISATVPAGNWREHWNQIKTSKHSTFEAEHRRKDGSTFPVEIMANHIEFEQEELACAFVRDITERKESQENLANAMHAAQAANHAKSEFLAVVSHEMRTPLNSILGTIDLSLQGKIAKEQKEMMQLCRRSGIQLKELINDMLDYSQIQAGRFSLQHKVMDMGHLFDRIRNVFTPRAQEKGLEFRWRVARTIPSTLIGDERRLSQVIENLLNNAVKFTDSGYVSLLAEIESITQDEVNLRFAVEDSGIGIAPENRERVFHRFEQLDSGPTRTFGGVGLGLSICVQLVELMQGKIHIEDGTAGGSKFVFTARFRRLSKREVEHPSQAVTSQGNQQDQRLHGVHVLLVEDDPPSRLVATKTLEIAGVKVTAVEDGLAAVETFRSHPDQFDAILMDVMMPRLDGIEATKRIRQLPITQVPVIAMTAQAMVGDRERILRSQVDAYIAKPIDRRLLLTTLAELVATKISVSTSEQTPTLDGAQIVDFPALQRRCDNDDALLAEIVRLFGMTCDESLAKLELGLNESNQPEVVAATHRLKGAIGNMCAPRALALCEEMERNARSSQIDAVRAKWIQLQEELAFLRMAITQQLKP